MSDQWIVGAGFSRGIGFEIAKQMQSHGYKLLHVGRNKFGSEEEFVECELAYPISVQCAKLLQSKLKNKNIYGFFYGAGVIPNLTFDKDNEDAKVKFWESQHKAMFVNYFSCAQLLGEVLPFILASHSNNNSIPFVAHISSMSGIDPFPGFELYGITKSATLKYFANLATQFSPSQLACLSLHPGTVKTDMLCQLMESPEYEHLPVVDILKVELKENRVISAENAAQSIVKFLFDKKFAAKRKSAHGQLYLADSKKIIKF